MFQKAAKRRVDRVKKNHVRKLASLLAQALSASPTDAGGPTDKTLYLTIPKIGLQDKAVYDSLSEEKLKESAIHLPGTGFPWQRGANTYIAGHRLGYFGTDSWLIFYKLNEFDKGN